MNEITKELISTIAENQPKVKEQGIAQGIEQGKQEVISNSKYIEKQASGKVIQLDDVSEVYHSVKVKADTDTEVEVFENLIPYPYAETNKIHYGVSYVTNADGSVVCNGISTGGSQLYFVMVESPKTFSKGSYYFKCLPHTVSGVTAWARSSSTTYQDSGNGIAVNLSEDTELWFYIAIRSGTEVNNLVVLPRFYNVSEWQTITATPTGTEVASMCPDMTFIADTDITVYYYSSYGMQTEYDRFWDNYQYEGCPYYYAFAGAGWTDKVFRPKRNMKIRSGASMFAYSGIIDLIGCLERQGVVLDTSTADLVNSMFYACQTQRIPTLDLRKVTTQMSLSFASSSIVYIEELIFAATTPLFNQSFSNATNLVHVIFSGTIASDINLQWSTKLDLESLASLFNCLKNFLADDPDNAHTKTITLSAESWALLDEYVYENGYNDYTSAQDVVLNVLGWNVA